MPIDLYQVNASGPCRAVRLAAAAIGVELNLKICDISIGENITPEFLKMNPQHTIPTINDNGFYLWESHAIMTYLANQYGKNDSLYPKDPKKRALVDQRLYFNQGVLYQSFIDYYFVLIFATDGELDPEKYDKMCIALSFLEKFLEGQTYVAGKNLTLADLALTVTTSNFKAMDFDLSKYPNILKWHARIAAEAPKYQEIDVVGQQKFRHYIDIVNNKK